ncbi:MAG: hypothetical protein K2X68_05730 [Novosphingobium sp.]|nr:hypothetical protein [Novosphingobium sp.]
MSSIAEILGALPDVQDAVRLEIAERIAAGEIIASSETIDRAKTVTPYTGRRKATVKRASRKTAA